MPAVSKAQQRFMGMVHAAQKGEEPASPEVAKVAKDMGKKAAKDFASTKHSGLPDHVDEAVLTEVINPEVFHEFMVACHEAGLSGIQIFGLHVLAVIATTAGTILTLIAGVGLSDLVKKMVDAVKEWNEGRKLNPNEVKRIANEFTSKLNRLDGGKKKFFTGLINKLKKADPLDKHALVSASRDIKYYADRYGLKEGEVTDRPEEPNSDDLNLPSAAIPGVSVESTLPTPTNNILWKATGKVCEGRSMAERVKMYEKKGGGWRMGKQRDEQVYNNLKEFYQNEIKPRKEAKSILVKKRMGESINEMTDEVGEADGMDHEVSMARASLINISKACQDLMGKIGSQEKDLPGWIQDHITNSENYIMQASKGYYDQDEKLKGNTITGPTQLDQNGK